MFITRAQKDNNTVYAIFFHCPLDDMLDKLPFALLNDSRKYKITNNQKSIILKSKLFGRFESTTRCNSTTPWISPCTSSESKAQMDWNGNQPYKV